MAKKRRNIEINQLITRGKTVSRSSLFTTEELCLVKERIRKIPHLGRLKGLIKTYNADIFLVGGFLRDIFLGVEAKFDFDFAVSKHVTKIAKEFSGIVKGRLVILDKKLRNIRVVLKKRQVIYNYDFSKFRGRSIEEDLERRDFTVNTLAVRINNFPKEDIMGHPAAKKDIERRILHCPYPESFADDPLRIMRAFSLSSLYGLRIDHKTQTLVKKYKNLLKNVAGERLAEELFKIFSARFSYDTVKLMDKLSMLASIFPEIKPMIGLNQGEYHHLDVWKHSLESLRCFETLVNKQLSKDKLILSYLKETVAQKRTREQLIKFACVFHDIGKPKAKRKKKKKTLFYSHEKIGRDLIEHTCRRLRFSLKEEEFVKRLIYFHLRPGHLAGTKLPTQRAVYRYFRDTKEDALGVLLLSLGDWRATRGPLTSTRRRRKHEKVIFSLVEGYLHKKSEKPLKKLINGFDVMRKLKIHPSPVVGSILKKIDELYALNKINTKKQALELIPKIYSNTRKNA